MRRAPAIASISVGRSVNWAITTWSSFPHRVGTPGKPGRLVARSVVFRLTLPGDRNCGTERTTSASWIVSDRSISDSSWTALCPSRSSHQSFSTTRAPASSSSSHVHAGLRISHIVWLARRI
ncbi:hypothetical protein SBRY_30593 [Actinacidiphila bryophytorum]|uniref:Uncharacterized protein n=1 Tax=Actinacidiphila bryophytorum TaxID=1436133 RepID=A0A9W4H194_9ACTN|nr:hypothetical protein SBRY_30593 [Actinacidiphila bryophytorum]